ncbi:polysaccharide deacetylase family protein [Clostridium sp. HCS.1]|uniref:polysaccharide deacetylase family protein n=1 Tax=Clostridium sp. HCS.1 TaxID=3238594 RepID=UPI003A102851
MKRKVLLLVITIMISILAIVFYFNKNYKIDSNLEGINIVKKKKYDASYEIEEAKKIYDINKKAEIIENINTDSSSIALTFEGLSDKETTFQILDLLNSYKIKATFFVTGVESSEDSSIIERIIKDGHTVGSGTLYGTKEMQNLSRDELISDFASANKILKDTTGDNIRLLKCSSTEYREELLASAYAVGHKYVVNPDAYLSYQSFKNYEEVVGYVKKLSKGNILSIKLQGVLDDFEYTRSKENEKQLSERKVNVTNLEKEENTLEIDNVTILNTVEWILKVIKDYGIEVVEINKLKELNNRFEKPITSNEKFISYDNTVSDTSDDVSDTSDEENLGYEINFNDLIESNNKKFSPVVSRFLTTEETVTYTFRGLSNEKVLDNVLESLKKYNAKGTFFVTKEEIQKYPDRINKIIEDGHEIGNGGVTSSSTILNKSTEEICKEIYEVDKLLKEKGISTNSYMAGYGYSNSNIQEAVSTIKQINGLGGYELITYTKSPILEKYKNMRAEEIISDYFNVKSYVSLSKGEVVYFRLDSDIFTDENELARLIEMLTENYVNNGYAYRYVEETGYYTLDSVPLNYSVVSIKNIQNTIESINGYGRYDIVSYYNPLVQTTYDKALELMKTNYIGNKNSPLVNFDEEEMKYLDITGTIDTNGEDVIFFTFDDWGGDPIINEILDVLNKHNAKASFFIISRYSDLESDVSNINPNLLRTIALNGHDIGSHNYNHELLGSSKEQLEWSLIKSYNSMANIIGDLNSLRPYFRPPTLYIEKGGLTSVFESGYKYSISGNISTHDYESSSSDKIVKNIESQLLDGVGNVIIMHINNQSYYTAEALDKFLTNNENGVYGKKYKIAKLSDYLSN